MSYNYEVVPDDCICTWYTQDAGGGYSELIQEVEPLCYEHGGGVFLDYAIAGQCSAGLFLEWADHMPTPPDLKEAF